MSEYRDRLAELLEREDSLVSKLDSLQIADRTEQVVLDLLSDIFKPYLVERKPKEGLTHLADALLKFTPLGYRKFVFFEIKAGKIFSYDLLGIHEIIGDLKKTYKGRYFSLVFIANSFDEGVVDRAVKEVFPDRVQFIAIETLIDLYSTLTTNRTLKESKYRDMFLLAMVQRTGLLPLEAVRAVDIAGLEKEHGYKRIEAIACTRDRYSIGADLSFRVLVRDRELLTRHAGGVTQPSDESVEHLVLEQVRDYIEKRPLADFAFERAETESNLEKYLSHGLKQDGIKLVDFSPRWTFDERSRTYIDRTRMTIEQSKALREQISSLENVLTRVYEDWEKEINAFRMTLEYLSDKYAQGEVSEQDYMREIKQLGVSVAMTREKMNTQLRLHQE